MKIRSTLLISCNTNSFGGGFYFRKHSVGTEEMKNFKYLFYNGDTARNGSDVRIYDEKGIYVESPFVHCFSQIKDKKEYFYNRSKDK